MFSRRAKRIAKSNMRKNVGELNLMSMIDIFTILVFFLLVNYQEAAALLLANIELNLPATEAAAESTEPAFALEVIVRTNQIEVGDRNAGVFSIIPQVDGEYDIASLTRKLREIKAAFPDQLAVTLLLESDIDYESMVHIMDAVQSYKPEQKGMSKRAELFPDIAIGDAPVLVAANK